MTTPSSVTLRASTAASALSQRMTRAQALPNGGTRPDLQPSSSAHLRHSSETGHAVLQTAPLPTQPAAAPLAIRHLQVRARLAKLVRLIVERVDACMIK